MASSDLTPAPAPAKPRIRTVLGRGLRQKCPRCGVGAIFRRWLVFHERCSACGLLLQRNYGDTWMFTNLMDRVPLLFGIAAIYFGFRVTGLVTGTIFAVALSVPMIATMKHRQGLALALDYLSRVYLPDPSDEIHGGREIPGRLPDRH
ncbi:MAG: hypothetical protein M3Q69_05670 [Acidobacteriota bacterium]|nr:hypothetical protein [Acidobacteriota bacterium]